MRKKILILFCCIILMGCSSVPKYTEQKQTLLVGKILFVGSNDELRKYKITFDGTGGKDIRLTIKNITTNTIFMIVAGEDGLFCSSQLTEGKYMLGEVYYKITNSSASADVWTAPHSILFEIKKNKVINIGTIVWNRDGDKNVVMQQEDFIDVRNEFIRQYPKSNWNSKDWTNYSINRNNMQTLQITNFDEWLTQLEKEGKFNPKKDSVVYIKAANKLDSTRVMVRDVKGLPKEEIERIKKKIGANL